MDGRAGRDGNGDRPVPALRGPLPPHARRSSSALADFENPLSILTKSTLVLRDLDVLERLDPVAGVTVSMSVGTLDESVRRVVEPGTPPGRKRLEILARFAEAGIRTGVLVAPILPGLTDDEEHLDEVLAACSAAGVASATPIVLHVRPNIREHFMPWLRSAYPWLYPRYVELYGQTGVRAEGVSRGGRRAVCAAAATTRLSAGEGRPAASPREGGGCRDHRDSSLSRSEPRPADGPLARHL